MPEDADTSSLRPDSTASKRRRRHLVLGGFVVLLAVAAAIVVAAVTEPRGGSDPTSTAGATGPISVTIESGLSAVAITELLQDKGVIVSARGFLNDVKAAGAEASLRPGRYVFTASESHESIIDKLTTGSQEEVAKVTIPEGLSIDQVGARLRDSGDIDGEEYEALARRPGDFVVPTVGGQRLEVTDLEGLLFPSTYFIEPGFTAENLVATQLATFQQRSASLPWANAESLGVTPYEIIIIASLIEKETSAPEERPLAAAVAYNRLAKDMRLEYCSSVRFALKKWKGALTNGDLEADSPYNTYRNTGLPPGPIASPGLDALKAALTPADVDYLYFVLIDEEGHHFFTSSYEEFLEAKRRSPGQ